MMKLKIYCRELVCAGIQSHKRWFYLLPREASYCNTGDEMKKQSFQAAPQFMKQNKDGGLQATWAENRIKTERVDMFYLVLRVRIHIATNCRLWWVGGFSETKVNPEYVMH